MAKNNVFPDSESLTEWMASTGFLFPRSVDELDRFNRLHGKAISGDDRRSTVSLERICSGKARPFPVERRAMEDEEKRAIEQYRMAARKGGDLPEHILNKMLNNQKSGESPQEEKN
ncbi:hypothetical protein [Salmonirosea aquatica]|uniref:Uncharacterized protein n=1 Tax=Salmonirosea aquatica TaxID=2654236 RepID=A0A7C9FG89_9BACT|nr:hypothetical protein [Cytophagaceae bacterium SJW1-29]